MARRRRVIAAVATAPIAIAALLTAGAAPVLAQCGIDEPTLQNGGFETPPVPPGTFVQLPAAQVPPWQTTDSLGEIELWGDGFLGVPAAEESNFAELNAHSDGTLYQDVISVPGEEMTWELLHRARVGVDSMRVLIGDATTADVFSDNGWDFISADLSDDTTAWGMHTDTYVVPAGQTCTRFAFRTVSTGSGSGSVGNFLDAVSFSIPVPPPTPTPTPDPAPTASASPIPTPPPTSTVDPPVAENERADAIALLLVMLVGAAGGIALAESRLRRSSRRP
jgi:hypothetical protein